MTPSELEAALDRTRDEVGRLDDAGLLDRWLDHSQAPIVPDLTILESGIIEAALIGRFGPDYHKAVDERRRARNA